MVNVENGFSCHWADQILDHLFGAESYIPPTIFVGLLRGGSKGPVELSGNGYQRVATTTKHWSNIGCGTITNVNDIRFPEARKHWGKVTHFAIYDAQKGGHMICSGPLIEVKTVVRGDAALFAASDIEIIL